MGYLTYNYYIQNPHKTKNKIYFTHEKSFEKSHRISQDSLKLFIEIFWGNIMISLKSIALGFIPFLFLSIFGVLSLSMPIGLFLAGAKLFTEIDQFSLFVSLFTHGIFEFPASLYASSIGVYLTIQTSKMILPKFRSKAVSLRTLCKQAIHSFILIVLPLLMIAAFIEAFISPMPK